MYFIPCSNRGVDNRWYDTTTQTRHNFSNAPNYRTKDVCAAFGENSTPWEEEEVEAQKKGGKMSSMSSLKFVTPVHIASEHRIVPATRKKNDVPLSDFMQAINVWNVPRNYRSIRSSMFFSAANSAMVFDRMH